MSVIRLSRVKIDKILLEFTQISCPCDAIRFIKRVLEEHGYNVEWED